MTRTIPAALAAAFAASPRKGAECVILVAKDGTRAGFTTWDRALTVDLGLGAGDDECAPAINITAVTLAAGLDASSYEIDGPATGEFSEAKVRGGKWSSADAWLVRLSPGTEGWAPLLRGKVADSKIEGRRFTIEVRNRADAFNQSQGRVLQPLCTAVFGDAQCTVARVPVACTVTAVTDDFRFTVDIAGDYADDYFNAGGAAFLTGALAGTAEAAVADFTGATGAVELLEPLISPPAVADTLNLYRGCSKLLKSDDTSLPTCKSYDNVVNFRGFPEVPGSRVYLRVSAPGTAYA